MSDNTRNLCNHYKITRCFNSKFAVESLIYKWAIIQGSCVITEKSLLNHFFSSQNFKYKFKLDSPNFYVDDNTRKLSIHWKKLLTLLFFIIVASRSDGCWLTGHTCSDGHISSSTCFWNAFWKREKGLKISRQ